MSLTLTLTHRCCSLEMFVEFHADFAGAVDGPALRLYDHRLLLLTRERGLRGQVLGIMGMRGREGLYSCANSISQLKRQGYCFGVGHLRAAVKTSPRHRWDIDEGAISIRSLPLRVSLSFSSTHLLVQHQDVMRDHDLAVAVAEPAAETSVPSCESSTVRNERATCCASGSCK